MTSAKITPVEKTIEVSRDAATAFEFFSASFDDWWPKQSHSVGADTHGIVPKHVRIEPGEGGRLYEILPDGREFVWGYIKAWQPGRRLVFSWQFDKPDDQATEIEINFTQLDSGHTRVHLIHRGWENDPNGAALRQNYNTGWDSVITAYVAYSSSM